MVSCNDPVGNIEMTATIRNPAGRIPDGFAVVNDPKEVQRVFTFDEMEQKFVRDEQNKPWMTLTVATGFTSCEKISYAGIEVCKDIGREYIFICRYPLGEKDVSGNFAVSGSDYQDTVEGQGTLSYTLEGRFYSFNCSFFYSIGF